MAKHSETPTAFNDLAHRAHFDADSMVVTLTAHGAGHDVIPVDEVPTLKTLRHIAKSQDWRCCEWPTLLDFQRF